MESFCKLQTDTTVTKVSWKHPHQSFQILKRDETGNYKKIVPYQGRKIGRMIEQPFQIRIFNIFLIRKVKSRNGDCTQPFWYSSYWKSKLDTSSKCRIPWFHNTQDDWSCKGIQESVLIQGRGKQSCRSLSQDYVSKKWDQCGESDEDKICLSVPAVH